ncbi:GrxB family glutaredoxin [Neisseria iguanae]|uniref:Glutaredoxin n=1 Tax=Neisseria iguanae TaxID=90242 RepID=A0A2P7TZG0_9NEIS|nr:GrxB family glutaredoxin [Neisseria iguanae]PSJ80075.1 glutaredoxin [Neisseria iguanae]
MKLYIYDHCPFCVRARMIFGLCGLPLETEILMNDDEATPVGMIGAKQVPILQKKDGLFMGESLDIVRYVDGQAGKGRLKEDIRPELQAWLDKVGGYNNKLVQPRVVKIGLPEFATLQAVKYFVDKKEQNIGNFETNLNKTAQYLERINADLRELDALIGNEGVGANGEAAMEDILLFPILRNLTVVRGIKWPQKVMDYLMRMSEASEVSLYFDRAL